MTDRNNDLTRGPSGPGAAAGAFRQLPARRDPRHQAWCAADVPAGADKCPRCGCWQPANTAALVHGAFRGLGTPRAMANLDVKRQELAAHLGGDVSAVQTDLIGDYARLDACIDSMTEVLARAGVLTPKGRTRAAVELMMRLMDRRLKLAQALGIERQARRVTSLADALRMAPEVHK